MPILQAFGPTAVSPPLPPSTVGLSAAARRFGVLPMPSLEWNEQIGRETAHLYERVKAVIPPVEWPFFAPYVKAINALKKERNAVILAHNYQTPEIYNCVADFVGDSLQLAREATKVDADIIVQAGVHFMAETAKILNPDKTVLIPDSRAGCSLASSITGEDVRLLRRKFPGVPVVAYVNTSAEVKAEVDICCTSSNAVQVVESLDADTVIFLPDQYLAKYVAGQTKKKIIAWKGACEVHERFTGEELQRVREQRARHPDHRASGVSARRAGRGRLHRLDRRHDRLGAQAQACARRHGHGMLHGGQRQGGAARCRVRAAVQPVPAHEADHAAEHSRQPCLSEGRGRHRSRHRRPRAPLGRADGEFERLTRKVPSMTINPRHPEVRAKRASKGDGPGRASFEARLRRAPQDDGEGSSRVATPASLLYPGGFLSPLEIDAAVERALAEDLGRAGDVTSIATIPAGTPARAAVVARKAGTISGLPLVAAAFRRLDSGRRDQGDGA